MKLLIMNWFGSKVTFSHSINSWMSLMFFGTNFCIVQNLAEANHSIDVIKDYENKLHLWLIDYNFSLESRFGDSTYLRNAWDDMNFPSPIIELLGVLLNIKPNRHILATFQVLLYIFNIILKAYTSLLNQQVGYLWNS